MEILLNGEPHDVPDACSIAQLIELLGFGEGRLAVELNLDVIPRGEHAGTELKAGDRVEIVRAIGGG